MPILRHRDLANWIRGIDVDTDVHSVGDEVHLVQQLGGGVVRTGSLPVLTDSQPFSVKTNFSNLIELLRDAGDGKFLWLLAEERTLRVMALPLDWQCHLPSTPIKSGMPELYTTKPAVQLNMDWIKAVMSKVILSVGKKLYWNTSPAFLCAITTSDKTVCIGSDGICLAVHEVPSTEELPPIHIVFPDRTVLDLVGGACEVSVCDKATIYNGSSRVVVPQPQPGIIPWRSIKRLIGQRPASMLTLHKEPLRRLTESAAKRKGLRHCRLRIEGERLSMFTDSDLLYVQKCHDGADCRREENLFPLDETVSIHNPGNLVIDLAIDAALFNPILGKIDSEFIDMAVLEKPTLTVEIRPANDSGLRYFLPVKTK